MRAEIDFSVIDDMQTMIYYIFTFCESENLLHVSLVNKMQATLTQSGVRWQIRSGIYLAFTSLVEILKIIGD